MDVQELIPSNLPEDQRVLQARKILLECIANQQQDLRVRQAREIEELSSKYNANPPEDPRLRQAQKRLREIGEFRSKCIANPELVQELKQRFLFQQDPRVRERQERMWDAVCSKTYKAQESQYRPGESSLPNQDAKRGPLGVQRQIPASLLKHRRPGCFVCSLDEHPSSECPYTVEVPKNAIVGGGVDIVCKVCGGLFSRRCCNQDSGRARLKRLMYD